MKSGLVLGNLSDDDTRGWKHELGRAGEDLAAEYLERRGIVVLARNWTCARGELDIIGTDGDVVIFCEVKTRSGIDYGAPLDAVDEGKARRMRLLAGEWLDQRCLRGCPVRFDVVSVLWPPGGPVRIEYAEGVL